MRKLFGTFARAGRDSDVWPVALLLFAVLAPTVCLLWFMDAAMRNERLAARQKLADAYRSQLSSSQERLDRHWSGIAKALEDLAQNASPAAAFARCVQSGLADSVIILDEQGVILYPNTLAAPIVPRLPSLETGGKKETGEGQGWAEANRLEYLRRDFIAAAGRYGSLAHQATNVTVAARAFQAQARCLVRAGENDAAVRLVSEVLSGDRFGQAIDAQGRLIAANAELMVLELLTNRAAPNFRAVAQRLRQRLTDYGDPLMAASQRRFLMKELQTLAPHIEFPTLSAEDLAADFPLAQSSFPPQVGSGEQRRGIVHRAWRPGLWQFTTPSGRVLALVRSERLQANSRSAIAADYPAADVNIALLPPEADDALALVTLPAGRHWPGWRLALSLKDRKLFDITTENQATVYLWTGILVLAGVGVLALLAVRVVRQQSTLARLKNDLAATVSHELKTPLASMRVLVDTLLDSDQLDEQTAREYLQLIARENERLTRLIQNFLTFSRMERRKFSFEFSAQSPRAISDAAIHAMRERLDAPGCRFEAEVDDDLPDVRADPDALATALINLLDNACKYSEDIKRIILRVRAENGNVVFSIRDNGVGIAPHEANRIFQPFHQADRRLSRKGSGCGLGLSIVQYIVRAHAGRVSVESRPGDGSTFTISIPSARGAARFPKEAVA